MPEPWKPPLRLTIVSSTDPIAAGRARELERILNSTAAGIGVDLGELEASGTSAQGSIGERFELRHFTSPPPGECSAWLDATQHSVVVVLIDSTLLRSEDWRSWLEACAAATALSQGRHRLLPVAFGEQEQTSWLARSADARRFQAVLWTSLDGENAGRADQLALRTLHTMIRVLAKPVYAEAGWKLRLFLSHAKQDGFYLAQSLRDFLARQHWLESFYDAHSIQPSEDWEEELREGVRHSILVALRTDAFDLRPWCRQELLWAEAFGVPRMVVDARSSLVFPACDLPFDGIPTVRIPDGNLARVLFAALQIAVRSLLFQRRVKALQDINPELPGWQRAKILRMTPSIETIAFACRELQDYPTKAPALLLYPDPPLPAGLQEGASALAERVDAQLATPQQILLMGNTP